MGYPGFKHEADCTGKDFGRSPQERIHDCCITLVLMLMLVHSHCDRDFS